MAADPLNTSVPPSARRFVGCFDVLGFTKYVKSTPLEDVLAAYEHLLQNARYFTEIPVIHSAGGGGGVDLERVPYQIFSDTILVWSADSGGEHTQNFLQSCCCLVAASVRARLPLRGGVAYGECLMDTFGGRYIGRAIVDAHETEAIQEWIGVGLHESCFASPIGKNLAKFEDVVSYKVPVKKKASSPWCQWLRSCGCLSESQIGPIEHTLRWHGYADVNIEELLGELLAKASGAQEAERKSRNALLFCRNVARVND